jgi:hypothetical protein
MTNFRGFLLGAVIISAFFIGRAIGFSEGLDGAEEVVLELTEQCGAVEEALPTPGTRADIST